MFGRYIVYFVPDPLASQGHKRQNRGEKYDKLIEVRIYLEKGFAIAQYKISGTFYVAVAPMVVVAPCCMQQGVLIR
jgi:hypothetical protein